MAYPLARRIDRLARHAHRFHRYAHHPLCGAYASELIALGRKGRVCRGCALAVIGAAAGAALALALPLGRVQPVVLLVAGSAIALTAGAIALLAVRASRAGSARRSKLGTRLLPLAAWSFAATAAFALPPAAGALLCAITGASFAAAYVAYRKRGPERRACEHCPERVLPVCSGFAPMVRRERAMQRLAGVWISREGALLSGAARAAPALAAKPRGAHPHVIPALGRCLRSNADRT